MLKWIFIISVAAVVAWVIADGVQTNNAVLEKKEALRERLCGTPKQNRWEICPRADSYVADVKVGCRARRQEAPDDVIVYINWDTTARGSVQEFDLACD
jgi:hypothetical protein